MTGVVDTRLLLTLEFPPTSETKKKIEELVQRELAGHLLAPSIVLAEFIKLAGKRIGKDAAKTRLRLLVDRGMRIAAIAEDEAIVAGDMLLAHPDVPIADALIASFVKTGAADYVLSDDPHYEMLSVKSRWL